MSKMILVVPLLLISIAGFIIVSCSPPEPPPCPSIAERDYFWRVEWGLSNVLDHTDRIQYWGLHEDFYPEPLNDARYFAQVEFHHRGIIEEANELTSLNAPPSAKIVEILVASFARVAIARAEGSLEAEPGPDAILQLALTEGAYHQRTAFSISIKEVIDNWCP